MWFNFGSAVIVAIVLVNFEFSSGATVKDDNDTLQFPPLYELEPWARCRMPGDVYCLVDAKLRALGDQPSPLLESLQDYSKDELRHFNRTLIHRGMCLTRCANSTEVGGPALEGCLSDGLLQYGLQAEVLSVNWCSVSGQAPTTNGSRGFTIFCLILLAVVLVATLLEVVGDKCAKWEDNKYLVAFSIKKNWSLLMYDRSLSSADSRTSDLACIDGIRFLAVQCVIFSHVLFNYIYSYTDNPDYIENMYDAWGWRIMLNSPLWVQAFFSLSAFFTAYGMLIFMETKEFTWKTFVLGIIQRWIRLTPAAIFALWVTMAWVPRLGSGPQWAWLLEREAADCSERWWYHALYVHNHLPLGKLCMGHTWYLAVDMQLHILGMVVLAISCRVRRALWPTLGTLLVGSAAAAGLVAYYYHLTPIITGQAPESLRNLFAGNDILRLLYVPSYMNGAGYVCGLATAFIFYKVQGGKLHQNKVFRSVFQLSLLAGSGVVCAGGLFLTHSPLARSPTSSAVYSALDRTLVAVCFNIFLLGCITRCKFHFRALVEWPGAQVLGRLSYCAFLLHFLVLRVLVGSNTQLAHMSVLACISLLLTTSVFTYLVSVPVYLMVESPAVQLWKALTSTRGRKQHPAPASDARPRSPTNKLFDLISQLRRDNAVI